MTNWQLAMLIGGGLGGLMAVWFISELKRARDLDDYPDPVVAPVQGRLPFVAVVTEREIRARLLGLAGTPGLEAVYALLDESTKDMLDAAMEEGLTESTLRTRMGAAAGLTEFRAALAEKIQEAIREKAEEQEKTEGVV